VLRGIAAGTGGSDHRHWEDKRYHLPRQRESVEWSGSNQPSVWYQRFNADQHNQDTAGPMTKSRCAYRHHARDGGKRSRDSHTAMPTNGALALNQGSGGAEI
jgi:hypothetical protein